MEEGVSSASAKKEIPKVWDHTVEYVSAPPKPGEDPWKVILDPLMERDKIQCDAWKEEVQNLLIFAGLFSAVVTAFAIESYKLLQPDPDDNMFNVVAHIAARLDNPTSSSLGIFSNQAAPPFSPSPSAIRVNIFWFLSLVLSLTTVLVGIISLQWLREYQSYPNFSPRETLALFHMRSDGFKQWHVGTIFATLPLLLQAALVLFFGGTIDFLLSLDKEVAIPVAVVIGLALFFLIATTMLPSLQSLMLYASLVFFRRPALPPSQCPYKSPQSWAFHRIYYVFEVVRHSLKWKRWSKEEDGGRRRRSPTMYSPAEARGTRWFSKPFTSIYGFFQNIKKRIVRMLLLRGIRWQGSIAGDLFSDIAVANSPAGATASGTGDADVDHSTPRRTRRNSSTQRSGYAHYHAVPEPPFHRRMYNAIVNFFQTWPDSMNNHVLTHISATWRNKTWIDYDLTWLNIRNSCQIGIYDSRPRLEERYLFLNENLPLFDVSKALQFFLLGKDKRRVHADNAAFPVVYYCFRDLTSSFLSVDTKSLLWANSYYITSYHLEDIQDSWNYLDSLLFDTSSTASAAADVNNINHHNHTNHKILPSSSSVPGAYPITFAKVVADSQDESYRTFMHTLQNLHLLEFFENVENHFTAKTARAIREQATEAHIRLMRTFYGGHGAYHSVAGVDKPLPKYCRNLNLEIVLNNEALFWQCLNVFVEYFKFIAQINTADVEHFPDSLLHDHPRVKFFLWDAAAYINFMLRSSTFRKFQHAEGMEQTVVDMLESIMELLQDDVDAASEMTTTTEWANHGFYQYPPHMRLMMMGGGGGLGGGRTEPDHVDLFYCTAVFAEQVIRYLQKPRRDERRQQQQRDQEEDLHHAEAHDDDEDEDARRPRPHIYHQFAKLFHVMRAYKREIVDVQGVNQRLQDQFEAHGAWERQCDFRMMSWWSFLDYFPSPGQNFAKLEPLLGYGDVVGDEGGNRRAKQWRTTGAARTEERQRQRRKKKLLFSSDDDDDEDEDEELESLTGPKHIRINPRPIVVGEASDGDSFSKGGETILAREHRSRQTSSPLVSTTATIAGSNSNPTSPATASGVTSLTSGHTATTSNTTPTTAATTVGGTAAAPTVTTNSTPTDPETNTNAATTAPADDAADPKFYTVTIYEPVMPLSSSPSSAAAAAAAGAAVGVGIGGPPLSSSISSSNPKLALRYPHPYRHINNTRQNSKDTAATASTSLFSIRESPPTGYAAYPAAAAAAAYPSPTSLSGTPTITPPPPARRPTRKAVPTFVPADILLDSEPLDAGRTIRVYLPPGSQENSPIATTTNMTSAANAKSGEKDFAGAAEDEVKQNQSEVAAATEEKVAGKEECSKKVG